MKTEHKIIGWSVFVGAGFWVLDGIFDHFFFYKGTAWSDILFRAPAHELYMRSIIALGFIIFGISVSRIMVKRKLAEEQLKRHKEKMEHASRLISVGEMASTLAHEINQPLCAIMTHAEGCAGLLRSQTLQPDKLARKIETVTRQAERAGQIVARIRKFVQKGKSFKQTVDINQIIRESAAFGKTQAEQRNTVIKLDLDKNVRPIQADHVQIEQVILNLIHNGLDAMGKLSKGKRITISSSMPNENNVEVSVLDRGTGIPQENMEQVFDSFYSTKSKGLGLGLSISRSIVESHGGRLWVTPNQAEGVTFHFTLPVGGTPNGN